MIVGVWLRFFFFPGGDWSSATSQPFLVVDGGVLSKPNESGKPSSSPVSKT